MGKKSFKGGLGSLLNDTVNQPEQQKENEKVEVVEDTAALQSSILLLQIKLKRQNDELRLWRTGKLTVEKFEISLREHNLRFNRINNSIEKI
jgi:hypothetical protein